METQQQTKKLKIESIHTHTLRFWIIKTKTNRKFCQSFFSSSFSLITLIIITLIFDSKIQFIIWFLIADFFIDQMVTSSDSNTLSFQNSNEGKNFKESLIFFDSKFFFLNSPDRVCVWCANIPVKYEILSKNFFHWKTKNFPNKKIDELDGVEWMNDFSSSYHWKFFLLI